VAAGFEGRDQSVIAASTWLAAIDDLVVSEEVREALARDAGRRVELAEVAREAGFDPAEFGL